MRFGRGRGLALRSVFRGLADHFLAHSRAGGVDRPFTFTMLARHVEHDGVVLLRTGHTIFLEAFLPEFKPAFN
jgi:hypothetical protein